MITLDSPKSLFSSGNVAESPEQSHYWPDDCAFYKQAKSLA